MLKPELTTIAESILKQYYQFDEFVETLVPLKGGEWSAAYKYRFDGYDYVIRLSNVNDNFYRDKFATGYSSVALPIPQIINIDKYEDQYYALSPFYYGEPFEKLSVINLDKTISSFIKMMTALQSTNLNSIRGYGTITNTGLGAFNSWNDALLDVNKERSDSLIPGWKSILRKDIRALSKYNLFYQQLDDLVSFCPKSKGLIHGDLLYQNLLVDNAKISAVLDWGCAMIGDPLYDIAIFSFFEPWYPAFSQVKLIDKMIQSYLAQSPDNSTNFKERMLAYQIHLTLGNIAYCAYSLGEHDYNQHIKRLEAVIENFG